MILFTMHVSSEVRHMSKLDDAELRRLAHTVLVREAVGLANLADTVEPSVVRVARAVVETSGKVITTGSGTSGIMAERLAHLLSVCGAPALYLPAMDALHGGMGAIETSDLVLAISKTGRSSELTRLVTRLVERGVRVVAVTESVESPFASAATDIAELPATQPDSDPGNMIAMASTLAVGAWGDAVGVVAMSLSGHTMHDVVNSHPAGGVGTRDDVMSASNEPVVGL
ncbi:SIS domain-containing protein [Rhodococcus sp. BP-252]|uniref:Sugar isomerase n=2 Tax=Mycobacteriales TaxID=85007 RepID=A0A177Y8B1_9NOCA|nr:SIS domain-containing protein [Rhodococcus sp. BP-320]MBY6419132.1 SIS domain-containing protein [Rhodococcus sp. BP-321]MBY6423777.1 SIS domain-containing protein [Rhodococcus sp. BP-324]MBY6429161.1 SIS domain-containing protein [Rhodococcus sp. BP-323]MBY6434172.1 SIS domain-containing protein [Rhodococcus sp. BP-322]MBY6443053.1 SIS domain-containing protein [Rhodococcus sp. BP-319]MBY6447851.1 SIS domain-containing protein [Rhodococcus sp. BP-318]MBY6452718.1 SIS domain-containing pr